MFALNFFRLKGLVWDIEAQREGSRYFVLKFSFAFFWPTILIKSGKTNVAFKVFNEINRIRILLCSLLQRNESVWTAFKR